MNTTEIAADLLAATTLTEETTAPIREYRRTKRATGAPVDLEDAVVHAANRCQEAVEVLRDHLLRARREADERIAALDHAGARMGQHVWFVLDGHVTANDLNARLGAARERFEDAVRLWAALADRIVATPEDMKRHAEYQRAWRLNAWGGVTLKALKAAVAKHGIKLPRDASRAETNAALADAGVDP